MSETIEDIRAGLPGFDCGRCGASCDELAARIAGGGATEAACEALADDSVELIINGVVVPLTEFPRGFLTGTVLGGVSALKGVGEVRTLQLRIVRDLEE
jgi:hypothetical protein